MDKPINDMTLREYEIYLSDKCQELSEILSEFRLETPYSADFPSSITIPLINVTAMGDDRKLYICGSLGLGVSMKGYSHGS